MILLQYLLIFIGLLFKFVYCIADTLPFQLETGVYYIKETNAIVYKGPKDNKWRYSTLDIKAGITQTYIIDGMLELSGFYTQYFLQNNQQYLYFYNQGDDTYQIIDLSILTSKGSTTAIINKYTSAKGCKFYQLVSKYESLYYQSCAVNVDSYIWKASSLEGLETATSPVKFTYQRYTKEYMVIDETFLAYKGKEYTNFVSIKSIQSIKLYDLKYDIFLFDFLLCKATMTGITFECQIKYDLGLSFANLYDCVISKVFNSNGKDIIFVFNYNTNNYEFLEAQTFNTISTIGDRINIVSQSLYFLQIKNYFYFKSYLYSFTYNSQSANLNIKLITSSLPSPYYSYTYYNFDEQNFQYGNFFFLRQDQKVLQIVNIQSIYCPAGCQYCPIQNHNQCCSSNCIECNDEKTCLTCSTGYILQLDQTCDIKTCPISAQIDNINKKCICDPNATFINKECKCNNSYYLSGNQCQKCQSNCDICQNSSNCQQCSSGFYLYPNGSCQLCDIQKGFYINNNNCISCDSSCLTCEGSSQQQCTSCYDGFSLLKKQCQQVYLILNNSVLSQDQVQNIDQSSKTVSSVQTYSSYSQNIAMSLLNQQSFAIVIQGLVNYKLSFLALISINLPDLIYMVIKNQKDQLPQKQFQVLNVFKSYLDENQIDYCDTKFYSADLPDNILFNCGSGLILFFISLFTFVLFYLLIEKVQNKFIQNLSTKLYDNLISSFVIQYFQLCILIFVVGINAQIKYFINNNIESKEMNLCLSIVLIFISFKIFQYLFYYLNRQSKDNQSRTFYIINRDKIQNQTIYECQLRRNYLLINLFIETFLLPTFFIQFSAQWMVVCIISIVLYLVQLIITIIYRPFISKLTNAFFIINQFFWLALFIEYLIVCCYCSKSDYQDYESAINYSSLILVLNVFIILLLQPAYGFLQILVQIYDFVKSKLRSKEQNAFYEMQSIQLNQQQLMPSSQIQEKFFVQKTNHQKNIFRFNHQKQKKNQQEYQIQN
ncbi:transmembrane protein, putative (macronuclear) [Tetrahymena thermophila SB210]|uniref:Transmembrane protein, putative n=1 Tax=Tetrahymena thermophila (strain SB210) TaxID=312017 RepID=Q22DJ0_TETTS|nr:transmembrane protein, putative [Tetrahymena thermophila SB210]EAR83368.2 transmembrane protein, putative [Tetrahymena thermophila SB210]|eukprot:XP_001031031.2 transmembrane protein, putative [Tetrahymena thermophila SB210]